MQSAVDSMAWHSNSLRIGLEATSLMWFLRDHEAAGILKDMQVVRGR